MNSSPISIIGSSEMGNSRSSSCARRLHNRNYVEYKENIFESNTPNAIDKVVDWNMTVSSDDETRVNDTFYRYDYKANESDLSTENEEIISVFHSSVPLCNSSPVSTKKFKSDSSENISSSSHSNSDCSVRVTRMENLNRHFSKTITQNGDIHFNSLSTENEKKELYNYLKLMNHADKKKIPSSPSIRSTRAKILERKELANRVSTRDCNNGSDESVQSITSTNDLSSDGTVNEMKIFNFVMPPNDILNEFNDFYHWIAPLVKKNEKSMKKNKLNGEVTANNLENGQTSNIQLRNRKYLRSNIDKKENYKLNKFRKKYRDKSIILKEKISYLENDSQRSESDHNEANHLQKTNGDKTDVMNDSTNSLTNEILPINKMNIVEAIHENDNGIVEENNVHIRVDYDTQKTNEEQNEQKSINHFKIKQIFLHHGFNVNDIDKSHSFFCKIRDFLNHLSTPPVLKDQIIFRNIVGHEEMSHEVIVSTKDTDESQYDSDATTSMESENSSSSSSNAVQKNELKRHSPKCDIINPNQITPRENEVQPFNDISEVQPLHNLLKKQLRKPSKIINDMHDWDSDSSTDDKPNKPETNKTNSHFISFDNDNGAVQSAIYVDFQLLLIQEYAVSLWNQTALGNVLGAQNLWILNGCTKKLILNKECIRKDSLEMVASMESCIVYVELWTKEHKSDIRQGPVADVFATVYFWIQKQNKMDRKVLQLENINGFADDVQYVVLKPSLNIVVSWHSIVEDNKVTQIHVYTLATDLQKVVNVQAMAKVDHYVSSLHNIEDCEELLMGCGEKKITLWNIQHGYIVATIELSELKLSLCTLWVKCDRGILFTLQQCVDGELRLIAINGRNLSWKRLKSYKPSDGFERIQNVYIENGILISFYEEGILCWKAQTGEQILEEMHSETDIKYFPSGRHLIILTKKHVFLQHALTHLLTVDD